MKSLFAILALSLAALPALADQTITCHEINKSGSRKAHGGTVRAELAINRKGEVTSRDSTISLRGFWKKGAGYGRDLTNPRGDQSKPNAENQWAHLFFNDNYNGGYVEYQLQFKQPILGQRFSNERAVLVMGMEDNSSEPTPSWGYDLECSGRVN